MAFYGKKLSSCNKEQFTDLKYYGVVNIDLSLKHIVTVFSQNDLISMWSCEWMEIPLKSNWEILRLTGLKYGNKFSQIPLASRIVTLFYTSPCSRITALFQ